jgi:tetratricopeptide (TPR) repeat protein
MRGMRLDECALLAVLVASLGCGSESPPPKTSGDNADLALLAQPSQPPPTRATEPKLSPEVQKGVEALEANDIPGATTHFQAAIAANAQDADALYYLGAVREKAGDLSGAENQYKAALAARAGFAAAAVNLSALYDDAGRYDEALAVTGPALAAHPKEGSLHLNAGIALGGKKDQASATKELDTAVAIAPSDPMFKLVYAHWMGAFGQRDAALAALHAALPLAAKNVGVLAAVAHELHVLKAFGDCVTAFTTAIALKDSAELWTERAACKIGAGDDAGALTDLQTAVSKDASYAPAQYYLGNELAKAHQVAPAIAAYQAFLKLEPNGLLAKGVAEKIRLAKAQGGH